LAGGGFKGGSVVGATDVRGETVQDRPTSPTDLIASMYDRLGIDADAGLPLPDGSRVPATTSTAGLLKEII
jgi:hypothetical protein